MKEHLRLNYSLLGLLSLSFVVSTVVGTLSHEAGHFVVARLLGYKEARIHYDRTSIGPPPEPLKTRNIATRNSIRQQRALQFSQIDEKNYSHILWGGPCQTMATGTFGLLMLYWTDGKRINRNLLFTARHWFWVFISLFWLRQLANFFLLAANITLTGRFGNGDEVRLAIYYNLPFWLINFLTAGISVFVLYVVVFRFVPVSQRFTFIVAGLCGGITGYVIWLGVLGPVLIP